MGKWMAAFRERAEQGGPKGMPVGRGRRCRARRLLATVPFRSGGAALLALSLAACGQPRETAVQNARGGDLLVQAGDHRVELLVPFQPGVANGLYKGVVKVSQQRGGDSRLYRVNAVCSLKGEPGWQTYDNLYGDPIRDSKEESPGASPQRWQVFYHFDGRIESNHKLTIQPWMARLKDNLCRRGDFDDRDRTKAATP